MICSKNWCRKPHHGWYILDVDILGINENKIISGTLNGIPIPSSLWSMVKKPHKTTFMKIAGFSWKYPCIMSCNKGYRAWIGQMVKYLAFWDCERRQKIWFDAASSKGIPEEVANELDVSLIQIDTYRFDGEINLLLGHISGYIGGGLIEILSS